MHYYNSKDFASGLIIKNNSCIADRRLFKSFGISDDGVALARKTQRKEYKTQEYNGIQFQYIFS